MNCIEIKDLCFSYEDGEKALNNISMVFKKGKTTALLGGNGAGKSTLFLNINGVLKPEKGKLFIEGKQLKYNKKDLLEIRKKVGIVFQDPENQLFSASVRKDISFGVMNQGLSNEEIKKRLEFVIKKTRIESIVNKPTHSLSYGQKKRVAIAGVLIMNPSVIILDEPTAGLDPCGVNEILSLMNEIKDTMGITIIISTHDIDLVPLYCDDVFVMNKGSIVFEGTPEELFLKPELLREHSLRLPRIAHLMSILYNKDHINVNKNAATISQARKSIKELFECGENDE
ncbi:UNVERIFIED_CONTAM: cobalt/nickel transport system ATP-binding protein [Acetivibrio alkalicellulosi]